MSRPLRKSELQDPELRERIEATVRNGGWEDEEVDADDLNYWAATELMGWQQRPLLHDFDEWQPAQSLIRALECFVATEGYGCQIDVSVHGEVRAYVRGVSRESRLSLPVYRVWHAIHEETLAEAMMHQFYRLKESEA